ncbi:MAG: 3-methyl-2-oxobutanoate hydroxymethyltransferase [Verrucomicrobia bacterium]|nr:3-methyl-2-oxobutanoate hydroxymethyltransferase [Verrucomicrobiota bacterium]NBS50706.1 3-methyl-2-oxobutanoate hydroxymethyltransferase [Verrucomicrobiota bacterium]NBS79577.1 3-methyl-2-oxobutanoate hydroxymethyltransferase [bacterium]NBY65853.1 3-methyl-2-oxobutanoate hydroxymethyltransferase [Verrucomicrobiota bacterium]
MDAGVRDFAWQENGAEGESVPAAGSGSFVCGKKLDQESEVEPAASPNGGTAFCHGAAGRALSRASYFRSARHGGRDCGVVEGKKGAGVSADRLTPELLKKWPKERPLLSLTAYDYPMGRILDEVGVDLIHVGDSLGMVVLGMPDTTGVTMADMIRATEAVSRGRKKAMISADLPFESYVTLEGCVRHSKELLQAGADAVKPEGGREIFPQIEALEKAGIPWIGHLGMLPQNVKKEGGYRKKGKSREEARQILEDAKEMEKRGACAMVLELMAPEVAAEVTRTLSIPTIGIGAGDGTTGQIRVTHDLLGLTPWYRPGFVKGDLGFAKKIGELVQRIKSSGFAGLG